MKLRTRLALNTFVAALVLVPGVYATNDFYRRMQADRALATAIDDAMAGDGRMRCEAEAATFGGGVLEPLPPVALFRPYLEARPQIFGYDADFRSANPAAPPFPEDLRAALLSNRDRAIGTFPYATAIGRQLAVRMPWADGPCAILLSRFGPFALPFSTEMWRLAILTLTFVGSALLAAGPIIARIQRLTSGVKASTDSLYAIELPVTGRDEIGELEQGFNRAGQQIKTYVATIQAREATIREREASLRSVVSNTTHDVALPLTVVQGHLSALQALLPPDGPAQDGLRGAIRETHYLSALLHNLGVASRLESAMPIIERRPLNLNDLIGRVVARHSPLAGTLAVELGSAVPEQDVVVSADVTLLEQAASNLVHNAIQYNRPGGHVAILLETVDAGRRFSIRVIDDGPGIPVEERAHLTERTFRGAAGRARRPEGQGLGLNIVRQVADRHGFDLRVGESAFGGAEIAITGPCALAAPVPHQPATEAS